MRTRYQQQLQQQLQQPVRLRPVSLCLQQRLLQHCLITHIAMATVAWGRATRQWGYNPPTPPHPPCHMVRHQSSYEIF